MRVLIASFGSLGDLNPYIGLGRALLERGHQPVLAVPGYYVPFVEEAGLRGTAIRPDIDPAQRDLVRRIMHPLKGAEFLIRELLMPVVHESYEDLDAAAEGVDAIISHPLTFAAPLVAERRRLPWASSVLAPLGFFSRADPPLMAVDPRVAALQRNWPGLYRHLVPMARLATRGWGQHVHDLRRRLGLPPGGDPVLDGQFSPHLVLALFSSLIAQVQPDWPRSTVVTGAIAWDAVHGGMPEALAQFLDAGPPPVVFTLGTSAVAAERAGRFYDASLEATSRVGARAVLLIGKHDAHRPGARDRNVFVADWAPHSALFARAAAVVHQGGAGTLHTAMAAGRPMLVVPFAHDQGDNAVRAERLGIARVIFPSRYGAGVVAEQLRSLLEEPHYRMRSEEIGAAVRAEQGARNAVGALEQLVS